MKHPGEVCVVLNRNNQIDHIIQRVRVKQAVRCFPKGQKRPYLHQIWSTTSQLSFSVSGKLFSFQKVMNSFDC